MTLAATSIQPPCPTQNSGPVVICTANRTITNTKTHPTQRLSTISLDWIHISLPEASMPQACHLVSTSTGEHWKPAKLPKDFRSAYRCGMRCGGVRLYFRNRYQHPTCCLVLPASANPTGHLGLIAQLIQLGGRARRVDIAFDDRRGALSIDTIKQAWIQGKAVTHFQQMRPIATYGRNGRLTAYGVNFGSRRSDSYVRIYDKGLERSDDAHGTSEEKDRIDAGGSWNRFEL